MRDRNEPKKVGDVCGYIFGQPGNDVTYLLILNIKGDKADCWDLPFDMEVKNIDLNSMWIASDRELDSGADFHTDKRRGHFTYRQLAREKRASVSEEPSI
jgi:hypothetical protein